MSGEYVPGDRVWVLVDGYDWWPARVLSDGEVQEVMGARRGGCDVAVVFYRGTTTEASVYELSSIADADHICFLETSSEKAVTNNADLQAALQNALSDSTANELKTAQAVIVGTTASSERQHHRHLAHGGSAATASQRQSQQQAKHEDGGSGSGGATTTTTLSLSTGKRARGEGGGEDGRGGTMTQPRRTASSNNNGRGGSASSSSSTARRTAASAYTQLSHDELRSLAKRIAAATADGDVATLRALLCELDGVDVAPADLAQTQIGVAVGDMLGSAACQPLWPLARALVSFWARHLPSETLAAVRRLQQDAQATHSRLTGMRGAYGGTSSSNNNYSNYAAAGGGGGMPGSPTSMLPAAGGAASPSSPSSPLRFVSSGGAAGGASPPRGGAGMRSTLYSTLAPGSPTLQRPSFFRTLCCLLDNPSDYTTTTTTTTATTADTTPSSSATAAAATTTAAAATTTRVSSEQVEEVARELVKGIAAADERALLLSRLDDPELAFVREHLLSRRWSVRDYLAQPEEVFRTQREKAEEARRLRRRIEAEEAAKLANVNLTTLFTCPNCHKNRCHYYEQQTRSADEPTTKFISCLECKHTWTQE